MSARNQTDDGRTDDSSSPLIPLEEASLHDVDGVLVDSGLTDKAADIVPGHVMVLKPDPYIPGKFKVTSTQDPINYLGESRLLQLDIVDARHVTPKRLVEAI